MHMHAPYRRAENTYIAGDSIRAIIYHVLISFAVARLPPMPPASGIATATACGNKTSSEHACECTGPRKTCRCHVYFLPACSSPLWQGGR
jgi:hypothetical protein